MNEGQETAFGNVQL